jgi:hypothetical protein
VKAVVGRLLRSGRIEGQQFKGLDASQCGSRRLGNRTTAAGESDNHRRELSRDKPRGNCEWQDERVRHWLNGYLSSSSFSGFDETRAGLKHAVRTSSYAARMLLANSLHAEIPQHGRAALCVEATCTPGVSVVRQPRLA